MEENKKISNIMKILGKERKYKHIMCSKCGYVNKLELNEKYLNMEEAELIGDENNSLVSRKIVTNCKKCNNQSANISIDPDISDLICMINHFTYCGVLTEMCCSGHKDNDDIWIMFKTVPSDDNVKKIDQFIKARNFIINELKQIGFNSTVNDEGKIVLFYHYNNIAEYFMMLASIYDNITNSLDFDTRKQNIFSNRIKIESNFKTTDKEYINHPRHNTKHIDVLESVLLKIYKEHKRLYWNKYKKEYDDYGFFSGGSDYANDTFEIHPYDWSKDDDDLTEPNFRYKDLEVEWYKHLGRCTVYYSENDLTLDFLEQMYIDCVESIKKDYNVK